MNRLKRIEGQIRGIQDMMLKDRADQDILIQLEAVRSSVASTVAAFIEPMIRANTKDGRVQLNEDQIRALLRAIK
jgi:DNA-binding FrmR family transcriptional regulator